MSLGPAEILVLAVVVLVLVFVGPRRLPETARHLGPAWRDMPRDLGALIVADATSAVVTAPPLPPQLSSRGTPIHGGSGPPVGANGTPEGSA